MTDMGVALRMESVSKRYPGTLAVDDVDFAVRAGEVHALIGENGAGKSTLMNILAGSFDDYTGRVFVGDRAVRLHSPAAAKAVGIEMIHQELSLAAPLTVAENILAGRLPRRLGLLDRKAIGREAARWLGQVGLEVDPGIAVEELPQHEAQLVEIAKALANRPCILVMDEPTSALSREEVSRLFEIIRRLRRGGLAIVYISHHLSEIFEIADRVTVLRDGRRVATEPIADVTSVHLAETMVGRSVADLYARRRGRAGAEKLRVTRLSRYGFFHDVSFTVRAGEVLGIAGLSGAGRSELARSLCGIDPVDAGRVCLDGRSVRAKNCRDAGRAGIVYLTEDRKHQGLAGRLTVGENALSAMIDRHSRFGLYLAGRAGGLLGRLIGSLEIHPPDPRRMTRTLSGGNQQKVLLAKWLATAPEVLVLDEPTRGVDVGAKVVIHRAVAELADAGKSVVLISSDLPELVALSDRIVVMRKGHLLGEMPPGERSESAVLLAVNGQAELVAP